MIRNKFFYFTILYLISFAYSDFQQQRAKLLIYSGSETPSIVLDNVQFAKLLQLIGDNNFTIKPDNSRVMGYQGFILSPLDIQIHGFPEAESYLLQLFKDKIPEHVYQHILEKINTEYILGPISIRPVISESENDECDNTPIKGPDNYPEYNPEKDDFSCFIKRQWNNNCYNYGTDIVTNTFAQPGRGSGHKWDFDTCDDITKWAEADGLIYVGQSITKKLDKGHYVALLMWPNTNFHWVRLDNNGYWSHKPGGTEVRNVDNNGELITDPSKQDFSPWSKFCGYFQVIPSQVKIN
jgi:hypothetical protein